jgi:dipeptidyl aminopeptidase/acylaminoacyl peptidase
VSVRARELERRLSRELGAAPVPDGGAAARARQAVLEAHARAPHAARSRVPLRAVTGSALAAIVVAAALSAPGAAVGEWLRGVVAPRPVASPAPAALPSLPAPGRVLVAAGGRIEVVAGSRAPVVLGRYRDAAWSPHGRFVAVTAKSELLAVTPGGAVRWRVTPRSAQPAAAPRDPRWSPDGFRIAYLAGHQLRVVVGDGTDDRLFYGHVRDVAPAFRPRTARTVAWVDAQGHARVADVDGAILLWRSLVPVPRGTSALTWSPDGGRLFATGSRGAAVYDLGRPGGAATAVAAPGPITALAFPLGTVDAIPAPVALVQRRDAFELRRLGTRAPLISLRGHAVGLTASPDGRWLVTSANGQWLLVRADGRRAATLPKTGRVLGWAR